MLPRAPEARRSHSSMVAAHTRRFLLFPLASLVAHLAVRSATIRRLLTWRRFRGLGLIVERLNDKRLPADDIEIERDGIRYLVRLTDDVERQIYFGTYERADVSAIRSLVPAGGLCIDVGANVGFFSLHFARWVGHGGRVYAFEPDEVAYERLTQNVALNGVGETVRTNRAAVAACSGRAVFYRSAPGHGGWGSLTRFEDIATDTTDVRVTTIDEFMKTERLECVDLLKVDVEANEFELLEGGRDSLCRHAFKAILIEFNGPRLAQRGRTYADFMDLFKSFRYRPARLNLQLEEACKNGRLDPSSTCVNFLFVPE